MAFAQQVMYPPRNIPLFVALLMAVLTPRPSVARTIPVNTCVGNLAQIDGAVQQWALNRKLTATNAYYLQNPELLEYLKGSTLPSCPSGGRYFPGSTLAEEPRCSLHGHAHRPIDAERTFEDIEWRGKSIRAVLITLSAVSVAFGGRRLPLSQSATIHLVIGVGLLAAAAWPVSVLFVGDTRSAFPLVTFAVYGAGGALAFAFLGRNQSNWIRVPALVGSMLLALLVLLAMVGLVRFSY